MTVSELHSTGLANVRDLGGLPTLDGGLTRSDVLWRSDGPRRGDPAPDGMAWPPHTVIDLRHAEELGGEGHPLAAEARRVFSLPLQDSEQLAAIRRCSAQTLDLVTLYEIIMNRSGPKLAQILAWAGEADGPVLVHCTAGKDRTGITVAVLLAAAGVRTEAIIDDYVRTAANMPALLRRLDPRLLLPPPERQSAQSVGLMDAPAAAIAMVLDMLQDNPHGAAGWLIRHGAAPQTVGHWRRKLAGV